MPLSRGFEAEGFEGKGIVCNAVIRDAWAARCVLTYLCWSEEAEVLSLPLQQFLFVHIVLEASCAIRGLLGCLRLLARSEAYLILRGELRTGVAKATTTATTIAATSTLLPSLAAESCLHVF